MPTEVRDVFVLAAQVIPSDYVPSSHERCRTALADLLGLSWTASSDWSPNRSRDASAASRKAKDEFIRTWHSIDAAALTRLLSAAADLDPTQIEDLKTRVRTHPSAVNTG